jgi:hypothetical protein
VIEFSAANVTLAICYFATHRPRVTADHDVVRLIHGAGDLDAFQQDEGDDRSACLHQPRRFRRDRIADADGAAGGHLLSADRFMRLPQKGFGGASPLAQISSILRDDPNLNKDAATALDQLIKSTYARLRSQR